MNGLPFSGLNSTPGRSDPPIKPTSEVAHQPGQQPAAWRCPEHDGECEFCRKFGCDACDRDIEREAAGDV